MKIDTAEGGDTMALLDMQGMELSTKWCGGSDVSLLLCDSNASIQLCL